MKDWKGLKGAAFGKAIARWNSEQSEGITVKGSTRKARVRKTPVRITGHNNSNLALCRFRFTTVEWELFVKDGSHFCFKRFAHLPAGRD